jgi:ribosomal protein L32
MRSSSAILVGVLASLRNHASVLASNAPFIGSFQTPRFWSVQGLALAGPVGSLGVGDVDEDCSGDRSRDAPAPLSWSLWFAVPKKQVTRHKKRLKTTVQKRIPLRTDIVLDPRTGQVTRKHRLPFNWKDYLIGPTASTS